MQQRANVVAAISCGAGEHLLRAAWDRARTLEAELTICTAIARTDVAMMLEVEAIADRILATAPRGAMIRFDVRPGAPGDQIVACARELDAAEIIVGRAPRGNGTRLAHTDVCTALLHDATCPVLVAGRRRDSRRILAACEREDPEAPVLRAAAVEAALGDGTVTALRVDSGPIARAIVEKAIAIEADLIVVGSHARSAAQRGPAARPARPGIGRLLCGSIAEQVARDAPCSVLVVPVDDLPPP